MNKSLCTHFQHRDPDVFICFLSFLVFFFGGGFPFSFVFVILKGNKKTGNNCVLKKKMGNENKIPMGHITHPSSKQQAFSKKALILLAHRLKE